MNTKDELRERLRVYVMDITEPDPAGNKDKYVCPLCGSGKHGNKGRKDGAFHVNDDTHTWKCYACDEGGDIFDLYAKVNGLDTTTDFPKIVEDLCNMFGVDNDGTQSQRSAKPEPTPTPEDLERAKKRLDNINKYVGNMPGSPGEAYLKGRGFSDPIIRKFKLGYNPCRYIDKDIHYETISIPYPGTDYYTERILPPGDEKVSKYHHQSTKGKQAPMFIINEKPDKGCYFITEGQLDAISMYQVGAKNVISCQPEESKLNKFIEESKPKGFVIVADRDKRGEEKAARYEGIFSSKGIKSLTIYPPDGFKDSNDMLKDDPKKLKDFLTDAAKRLDDMPEPEPKQEAKEKPSVTFTAVNGGEYFKSKQFDADLDYFRKYKDRVTGFSNVDKHLRLYPGVAALTGSTSLGKTTFATQLCDQLVDRGETVIYFSLEQLPIEIFTKSLARGYYKRQGFTLKNRDIRDGATDSRLEAVKEEYAKKADRFNVVACDFSITADQIAEYVEDFIKKTGIKPIVCIDYLQLVSAPKGERVDDQGRLDMTIKRFKKLSKENELFILAISNMARSSYTERIGEDSFKSSGQIEFTCDYLFGLQLAILEDNEFFVRTGSRGGESDTRKADKQEKVDAASEAYPKEIVFKAVKNRPGQKVFKTFFKYYPDYDIFIEDDNSKYDKNSQAYKSANAKTEYKHDPR